MSDLQTQFSVLIKDIIFRFALSLLSSREDAEDVVQDVFEKLWKKRKKIDGYGNMKALSIKMTKDLCMDRLRHRSMKIKKLEAYKKTQKQLYDASNYDVSELAEITKDLIWNLPEKQKMAIHLRDVEQYEYEEISEVLGMDIQAIRMNLSRARKSIKEQLEKIIKHGL